jgi:signal transduction histidine kinase/pSer/pThr/pTyr-binding forkhead associated (FHA) protein
VLILTVMQGPDKGRKFELPDHEPQLIGRSSEALPLTDNTVSRRHAELTPDDPPGVWWIRDLQSQNGSYVNGVRISERTRLKPGDQIRTGATLFVFGRAEPGEDKDLIRLVGPDLLEAEIERTMTSNEDSVLLAEPEPRAAAVDHLRVIYRLTTITTQALSRQELLKRVLELVIGEFKPERGFIMLGSGSEHDPMKPAIVKYRTPPKDKEEAQFTVSQTIIKHAVEHHEGVLSTNAMTDPRFQSGDSVQRLRIRSAICSPIRFGERTFGAIYIDSSIANYTFTHEQLALMNAIGQHAGLALANADLYAQKLQTERLAAIGETVASLSHAIKNILQGLRGGADVVEMGLKKDDLKIAKGGWEILKRNLDRIVSLTLNMLAFSRQRAVEPELTHLGKLIDECSQLLEGQCNTKGVALIVDADNEIPPVPIDAPLMHQALMNLMTNAVEAVEHGKGVVTVRASYHASNTRGEGSPAVVELAVIDNGAGISRERLARLFEPFNTTKGTRGTGLGLAVTKRIVEEHRGRIRVDSVEGKGATFRMILPADTTTMIDPSETAHSKPMEL